MTDAEAGAAYECAKGAMTQAYAKSGNASASSYGAWPNFAKTPYVSGTHGGRYVNNYSNAAGAGAYGKYEDLGTMPVGSVLAKDSFSVNGKGKVMIGPLFLMEKMPSGFSAGNGDWKYSMFMPDGSMFGETNGKGSARVQFCADCHNAVGEDQDHVFLLPDEYRR